MPRYAVVGASSGTGLAIVRQLALAQDAVRAISRHPPESGPYVEPVLADVTDAPATFRALDCAFDAVFYTVDIHGLLNSRQAVRDVMYGGILNVISALQRHSRPTKIVLLSVIGPDKSSWVWTLLGSLKPGMKRNILDREQALAASGLPYVICRAPKLTDGAGTVAEITATAASRRLDLSMSIDRNALAGALILAAKAAPTGTSWDIFKDRAVPMPVWLRTESMNY